MSSIEASLRSLITGNAGISAIVSTRVYPVVAPDNVTFPCLTYQRITSAKEATLNDGGSFTTANFEINIWTPKTTAAGAGGFEQARDLARKIEGVLNGYRGTVSSVDIQGILIQNEAHGYETDIEVYRITQQWTVMFREG